MKIDYQAIWEQARDYYSNTFEKIEKVPWDSDLLGIKQTQTYLEECLPVLQEAFNKVNQTDEGRNHLIDDSDNLAGLIEDRLHHVIEKIEKCSVEMKKLEP